MGDVLARALTALAVATLAAVVGIGGLGFFAYAAYTALALITPPAVAAALVGLLCLFVTALLLLVVRSVVHPPPRRPSASAPGAEGRPQDTELAALLGRQAGSFVRSNFREAAGVAFVSGLILGVSPRARRALRDLLLNDR
ncbi:hypothetical protein [Arhodomonas sp. SL1]|uniref:hypothetical protein n=1 Tax=Arhodomonas sp. SL1 TaxID=3425691 RepID=UPI003F881428